MQMQATAGYAGGQIPNPYMAYGVPVGFAPPYLRGGRLSAHEARWRGMRRMPTVFCRLFAVSSLSSLS